MPAFRCSIDNANFPLPPSRERREDGWPANDGEPCPICGEPVSGIQNAGPDDEADLRSRVAHARFERYLEAETPAARAEREAAHRPEIEASLRRAEGA